jgi:uncharacterized protein YegL
LIIYLNVHKMPVQVDASYYAGDLVVRIMPVKAAGSVRNPYHIALLLDTSGSMDGAPLAAVIRTLHLLIDRMGETDMLTVIQYSGTASIVVDCAVMNARAKTDIHRIIDRLTADGGTNMEEAIEVLSNVSESHIDAVFLMTDGHVNTGITNSAGLLRLIAARLANGTPVNTLGFGSNHNAQMLRDMAVRSCGSYTYADSAELIPAIIGDIVGGLIDQVGSSAYLTAQPGSHCLELGADVSHPEVCRVGSLIADKPQWAVFRGPFGPQGTQIQLTWTEDGVTHQYVATPSVGGLDMMMMEEQVQRVHLVRTMTTVSEMLVHRNYAGAIAELTAAENRLALSPAAGRSFILRLQSQVDEMLDDVRRQSGPVVDHDVDMLTRMVSNVTALGTQHGFFLSRNTTVGDPDVISSPFSTSRQRQATVNITQSFQEHE